MPDEARSLGRKNCVLHRKADSCSRWTEAARDARGVQSSLSSWFAEYSEVVSEEESPLDSENVAEAGNNDRALEQILALTTLDS